MSLASYCLLFLSAFVAVSQAQYDYPVHPFDYFRSGGYSPYPSYSGYGVEQRQSSNQPDARFFFTTLTLTLTTTTSTSTFTTSTTCTTSTTTLSTWYAYTLFKSQNSFGLNFGLNLALLVNVVVVEHN